MNLHVLGSGSRGNALALEAEGAVLLVDAGFSLKELTRRAGLAGLDLSRLAGLVLTHEHGDHTAGAARLLARHAATVYTSPGTWDRLRPRLPAGAAFRPLGLAAMAEAGPFRLQATPVVHDAAEPMAVGIEGPDGERVVVACDLGRPTAGVRYLLRGAHAIVIEANHDEILLRTSGYPPGVQQRIAGSGGHLSNRAAAELVGEMLHPDLEHVVLAHLSERCNTPRHARQAVEPVLARAGFRGTLHVALQDEVMGPVVVRPGVQLRL